MSRFLIATMPIPGHIAPMAPVARRLVERGHEVVWYGSRFAQDKITATGARFTPITSTVDFGDNDYNRHFPERQKYSGLKQVVFDFEHMFVGAVEGMYKDLRSILEGFPADTLLCDPAVAAALPVERDCGIPVAMLNITVYGLPSRELPTFGLGLPFNNTPIGQLRNMVLGYVGTNIIFGPVQKRWREVCDRNGWEFVPFGPTAPKSLYLQPSVPAFEYPVSHIPSQVHFIGALLPETPAEYVPPAWWTDLKAEAQRTRRPIILVTQGTIATDADHLIAPTLRALANEEVLVVATTGGKTALEAGLTVPANARVEPFIPFGLIMSEVAVMITNGGYGGLTIAIANGVPVITAGTTEDKAEVGQRVGYTGVGINLKTNAPTPDQVRGAVRRLLTTPAYREAARRIQQEIARRDAPNTAVDLLEALATTRQPVYRR